MSSETPIQLEKEITDAMKKKEYGKKYYMDNKDRLLEMFRKPVICTCGKTIQRGTYNTHIKTIKHKAQLENITVFEYKIKNKLI